MAACLYHAMPGELGNQRCDWGLGKIDMCLVETSRGISNRCEFIKSASSTQPGSALVA